MAWIQRGPYRYYCRSVRQGKKVRRVHFGNGALGVLAANLDELSRLDRQVSAREQARHNTADVLLAEFCNVTDLLIEAALTQAGFHRPHRAAWRKRRNMTDSNIRPALEPFTPDDIREVLEAARSGDRSVLPMLRQILDTNPELWQGLGDVSAHAERAWIDLVAGPDLALGESLARKHAAIKSELYGPTPSLLEKMLSDRVALCLMMTGYADVVLAQAKGRDLTPAQLDHLVRRQDRAQRGYLAAIKALATIRKLLPDVVPQPLAVAVPECLVESLRREVKAARRGGSAKHADKDPEVTTKRATKRREKQTTRDSLEGSHGASNTEPMRDPCAA